MYIIKNAWKSITRSKGRNVLIGIIVAVIAISSCIGLSIRNAAKKAEEQGLESLSITATISFDRQSLMKGAENGAASNFREQMKNIESLSVDDMKVYAESEYVDKFTYTISSSIDASGDLEPVDTTDSTDTDSASSGSQPANNNRPSMPGKGGFGGMGTQGDFTIIGYSSYDAMNDFNDGVSKITDGSMFDEGTSELVCIINNELALYNDLSVGDTITLANPNAEEETYAFKVVGIYETTASETSMSGGMGGFSTSTDPANQIYVSYETLKAVTEKSASVATTSTDENTGRESTTALRSQETGLYYLKDVDALEKFEADCRKMGLSDNYQVISNDVTSYEQSLVPLKNLSTFATYFLVVVLVIGAVILIVLNIFNIRERKYEVGVMTAIGMKKGKVAAQFVTELFTVTIISMIVGATVGAVCSSPIANKLLEAQINSQQTQSEQRMENFGKPDGMQGMPPGENGSADKGGGKGGMFAQFGGQVANYVGEINAATDLAVVAQLLGIGILLTILSSCVAVVFILRYEPLKILANRS
ncbi:MAG: ABC transporter permease [Clostridiales bacterium]|nr:ABC transporter permease [Clostridiales bacterium]